MSRDDGPSVGETRGRSMKILPGILGSILLSFAATAASATIMFSPTPSGTGNNVVFNQQPPTRPELRSSATSMLPTRCEKLAN